MAEARFAWLRSDRRAGLALVLRAVRGGWLRGPAHAAARAELAAELAGLAEADGLTPRELNGLARVVLAMDRDG